MHWVKGALSDVVSGLRDVKEMLLTMPKQSSWADMGKTIAVTVGIYTAVMAIANGWFDSRIAPDRIAISRFEAVTKENENTRLKLELMQYRMKIIEKKLELSVE